MERMAPYTKNVLAWSAIMSLGLAAILASLYVSNWFLLALAAVVYGSQFVLKRITCPQCGTPVTYQGTVVGVAVHGGFIRKQCQACGWNLKDSG